MVRPPRAEKNSAPAPQPPPRRWPEIPLVTTALRRTWLLVVLLVLWEVAARLNPTVYFPPLSAVAVRFVEQWFSADPATLFLSETFRENVAVSLSRFLRGWGIAIVVGVLLGFVLARVRVAGLMYVPVVRFLIAVPKTALLPIAVQIFGIADGMNIFLIALGTVWLIVIHTLDGVHEVSTSYLISARSLRLSRPRFYLYVLLPAAAPSILAGIRVSLGIGLILMVVSELYATTSGLGYQIMRSQQTIMYLDMWSALVLVSLLGIGLNAAFSLLENRLLHWQRRSGLADL